MGFPFASAKSIVTAGRSPGRSTLADQLLRWWPAKPMTRMESAMAIRYLPALLALLSAFSLHAAEPAALARTGSYYGARTTEYPAWFKNSFLHLKEDIDEARKYGKRVIFMFAQEWGPY